MHTGGRLIGKIKYFLLKNYEHSLEPLMFVIMKFLLA